MADLKERGHEGFRKIVCEHSFLAGLDDAFCDLVCGCAKNVRFEAGDYLLREGEAANEFYLIRDGRVALEVHVPGQAGITFLTLGPGDIAGVSWLVPPYRWSYDARAIEKVRAISLDATCLRRKCEADHDLGYHVMMRFVPILVDRLHATQLQILDVYGQHG